MGDLELVYHEWMRNQLTYKGTLFTEEAISKYVRELGRILYELNFEYSGERKSLFEVSNLVEFDEVCILINYSNFAHE